MSFWFFQLAFFAYLGATALSLLAVAFGWRWPRVLTFAGGILGALAHTLGLGARWYEGGLVELAATGKATGQALQGWDRFTTLLSHPPFTNIYESLVFFAWALVVVGLLAALFWRRRRVFPLLVAAMVLADLTMGLASLQLNQTIAPLVPALQSWWLHVHVITAFLGYACFFLAAVGGILFLAIDGVDRRVFGSAAAAVGLLTLLALGGGLPWPHASDVGVAVLHQAGECERAEQCQGTMGPYECLDGRCTSAEACDASKRCPAEHLCVKERCLLQRVDRVVDPEGGTVRAALPSTTAIISSAMLLLLLTGIGFLLLREKVPVAVPASGLLLGLSALVAIGLGGFLEGAAWSPAVATDPVPRGAFVSLRSAPYEFALLVFGALMMALLTLILLKRERLVRSVPAADTLDRMVYRSIQVGFPLMTLTIITGAVWANYAWGRPWGWDPKETWSLISWIVYAVYLHARITHGWKGRRAAFIAIIGFLVVVFTFLGVNLGLTGSGLHSYGGAFPEG